MWEILKTKETLLYGKCHGSTIVLHKATRVKVNEFFEYFQLKKSSQLVFPLSIFSNRTMSSEMMFLYTQIIP